MRNNNRVTPDAVQGLNLSPSAAPVNQEIKYKFDTSRAEKSKALADGLAKLGKGMVDIDPVLEKQAEQNVLKAQAQADKNKQDWNNISQQITGMAIFNPYNKDAYERMGAENTLKAALLTVKGRPDIEKLDPADYDKFVSDQKQQAVEALNKSGYKPKNYGKALAQFEVDMKTLNDLYRVKRSAYEYTLTNNRYQHSITSDLELRLAASNDKTGDLKGVLNGYVNTMTNESGIPKEQQAVNLLEGVKNYIANNPDKLTTAQLTVGLKDFTINGTPVKELMPDFDTKVRQLARAAMVADYEDRQLALQNLKLIEETKVFNAQTEFARRFNQSDKSYESARQIATELTNTYGLQTGTLGFVSYALNTRNSWENLHTVTSNPTTLNELKLKAYTGELESSEITGAAQQGLISANDCFTLSELALKSKNEGMTMFKKDVENLQQFVRKNPTYFTSQQQDEIRKNINNIIDAEAEGVLLPRDAQAVIEKYTKRVHQQQKQSEVAQNKWRNIYNGSFRANASRNYYNTYGAADVNESTKALRQLGVVASRYGGADDTITAGDTVGANRGGYNHVGTDVQGAYTGRSILAPVDLTFKYAGADNSMGNYAVYEDKYGRYVLMMHLNTPLTHLKAGATFKKGSKIGTIGNTGRASENGCLHIEFWSKDLKLLSPKQYLTGVS